MIKIIIGIIFAILLIIFMVQNIQVVNITFIIWSISISIPILVMILILFGIFIGFIFTEIACMKNNKKKREKMKAQQVNESIKLEKAQKMKADKEQKQDEKPQ